MASRTSKRRRAATGRFVLRISTELHEALRRAARDLGLSLNEYCARRLAVPLGGVVAHGDAAPTVARAMSLFGDELLGLMAIGSWVRGDATERSDVDMLIVVDAGVEVTRDLYRRWDEAPLRWGGRPVDAHFVRLPSPESAVTGLWAEAAIDGAVIFERGTRVSEHLIRVRRAIAEGRLVRRTAHGQPYWTEVA